MSLYENRILPWLIDLAMRNKDATRHRHSLVPELEGGVLEIGIGSGLNLPFYSSKVSSIVGLDPSLPLLQRAEAKKMQAPCTVELVEGSAEVMPFEDNSFDSILTTWTLCSVPEAPAALAEMRRVLKPAGGVYFVEHGLAPEPGVNRWQNRLNGLWGRCAGGCHINRKMDLLFTDAGFEFDRLETGYLAKGPRILTYFYKGRARPR